ncbi:MAG TPA: Ig-like domain-containing protein [Gemmatimonadales bacterium]|nr:Ig-like domain-containing protein [Gemmatimonadales bacterium]
MTGATYGFGMRLWLGTLSRLGPICCALLLAACSGDDTVAPGALATITLSPSAATVTVGQTRTLTATGKDASGTTIGGLSFTWATSDAGIATVADGVVTGMAVGTATITVSSGGVSSDEATVTVTLAGGGATNRVVIDKASVLLPGGGESAQLTAQILDPNGSPVSGTITWSSSAPDRVSVDANGRVKGVAIGSAQIVAEGNGLRSLPTLVFVATPQPGALLVTDAQVVTVGPPLGLPPGTPPSVGTEYEVTLTGVTPPSTGTVVLGAETAPVAGKVVSTRQESSQIVVTLALAPLYELLTEYDIDLHLDLAAYPVEAVPAQGARSLAAAWNAQHRGQRGAAAARTLDELEPFKAFKCKGEVEVLLGAPPANLSLENNLTLVLKDDPGYSRHALEGSVSFKVTTGLKLTAGGKFSVDCRAQGHVTVPISGPFSLLVAPAVRVGVGAGVESEVLLVQGEITVNGEVGVSPVVGWECGGGTSACRALDTWTAIMKDTVKAQFPSEHGKQIKISAQLYAVAGLDLEFFAGALNAEILEARVGPEQAFDLAIEEDQIARTDYASSYDLKLKGVVEPGEALKEAIKRVVNLDAAKVSFKAEVATPLSESPKGGLSASKALVRPGEAADLTVELDQNTIDYVLLGPNVERVDLYRKREDESDFTFWKSASAIGSNVYAYRWIPEQADVGRYQFAALVSTKLPGPLLEVTPNSIVDVEVSCFSGTAIRLSAATSGTCVDSWIGTSTVIVKTPGLPSANITSRANITWALDQANSGNGITAYTPSGNFTLSFDTPDPGCTITLSPSTFEIVVDPHSPARLSIIDNGITPASYSMLGSQPVDFQTTAHCDGREDVLTDFTDFQVPIASGSGPFSPGMVQLSGHTDDQAIESTWDFARP